MLTNIFVLYRYAAYSRCKCMYDGNRSRCTLLAHIHNCKNDYQHLICAHGAHGVMMLSHSLMLSRRLDETSSSIGISA